MVMPPDPEGFLDGLRADFASMAASKEMEANDLENRMLTLRAEAAGLRVAAVGVQEGLDSYHREVARAKEFVMTRDGKDQPARSVPVGDREAQAERVQGRY